MKYESSSETVRGSTPVRPAFRPAAGRIAPDAGTLVLRDGSRRPLVRALREDAPRILAFLRALPEAQRLNVLRSLGLEPAEAAGFLERLGDPETGQALLVQRSATDERVTAFGGYRVVEDRTVAIALAAEPATRGLGVATLLLERLAILAASQGIRWFRGVVPPGDESVLRLLVRAGFLFEPRWDERPGIFQVDILEPELRKRIDRLAERLYTAASLRSLFYPRSVAVVGASRTPGAVGRRVLAGLLHAGFNGPVYPVNPQAEYVSSIRCHPSVEAIGRPVDLAVMAIPAGAVPDAVEDCANAGVKGLIVISAGYAETGEEGRMRQARLLDQVRGHGMRMVGPNCLGLIHTAEDVRLNASFAPEMPPAGSVALCSQSGALGIVIIALARRLSLGLSSFVSVGNSADVSPTDLLEFWEQDPHTRVALFYLESFGDPRRFARLARRAARAKPIVAVKAGRTRAGGRAASSHTAALAGSDTAADALFLQTGVIRADTLPEMFGIARALVTQPLPRGRRVAVMTNAGGPAILCADALEAADLELPTLSEATQAKLREFLPPAASTSNPVDMIASAAPEGYRRTAETLLGAEEVDALVVIYTPVGMFEMAEIAGAIGEAAGTVAAEGAEGKPILGAVVGEEGNVTGLEVPGGGEIPLFAFPEEIGQVLGKIVRYADWRRSDPGVFTIFADQNLDRARDIARAALDTRGAGWLSAQETRTLLQAAGVHVAPGGLASDAETAVRLADEIGYPVAVKLASVKIVHKTEIGAVKLGLEGPEAVRRAVEQIRRTLQESGESDAIEGVLVQPMLEGTAEVMIGMEHDPVFGPVVTFGLGGVHVEILRDVAFGVAPLTDVDARRMVREVRGYRLLEGYRGHPAADVSALEAALLRVSRLAEAVPAISEMDLNPVFALRPGEGYQVVDARFRVDAEGGFRGGHTHE